MAQRKVYECASHYPLEMLVPVGDSPLSGYKLKWMALPHPGGVPPAPNLDAAAQAALKPVPVLRTAAKRKSSDPSMVGVLSQVAKIITQNISLQKQVHEANMVSQLIHQRGHLCLFLPKFHCDLNWAENHWGKAKPFVRKLCDGTWLAMCQGIWLAFGEGNINGDLCQRFARKIREIFRMYDAGIDGPFAAYCQRQFNQHRLPFHDAASLAQWGPNSIATATKTIKGRRKLSCRVTSIDVASGSCCVEFMDGDVRENVRLEDLGRVADNATIRR